MSDDYLADYVAAIIDGQTNRIITARQTSLAEPENPKQRELASTRAEYQEKIRLWHIKASRVGNVLDAIEAIGCPPEPPRVLVWEHAEWDKILCAIYQALEARYLNTKLEHELAKREAWTDSGRTVNQPLAQRLAQKRVK